MQHPFAHLLLSIRSAIPAFRRNALPLVEDTALNPTHANRRGVATLPQRPAPLNERKLWIGEIVLDDSYLWLKTVHLFGVMIFMGNIIITGWWKFMADRTRNPQVIAFAQRQVTLTDYVFTACGATILFATGWGNAALHGMDVLQIHWLSWGLWLFSASGVIWVAILIPAQIRQERMAMDFGVSGIIPQEYWSLCRRWYIWGTLATVLPMLNLYWMVLKPA